MARKHEQTYFSIGVINKVVFTAVYSGLQWSTVACSIQRRFSEWQDLQAGQDF